MDLKTYKYIELYLLKLAMTTEFKKKTSLIYNETIQKINEMKKFNLDQDSIFINLKSKLFNG